MQTTTIERTRSKPSTTKRAPGPRPITPPIATAQIDVRPPLHELADTPASVVHEIDREIDEVHEAALDSFPASDAPSWSSLRVGAPAPR